MARYDLYYQALENPLGIKIFTTGFNRSVGVKGPMKLVLQWLKLFMTTKGSDPTRPEEGTDFPNLIGSNVKSKTDLRDVVLLSIQSCNKQISAIQKVTQPDKNETLKTAVLTKFELSGSDGFDAYVAISNLADEEITIKLPDFATRT